MTPRTTKYRAWTGTEMVIVQSLCFNDKGALWYGPGAHMGWAFLWPGEAEWTENDPKPDESTLKPVMQWTGLRDKNGVEIFEGDILGSDNEKDCGGLPIPNPEYPFTWWERSVVTWDDKLSRFLLHFWSPYGGEGYCGREQHLDLYVSNGERILGNVYANSELLKP